MVEIISDYNKLQFSIIDYEFPGNNYSEEDDNWLIINIYIEKDNLKWEKSNPSLLTWEVQKIIEWFSKISNNI